MRSHVAAAALLGHLIFLLGSIQSPAQSVAASGIPYGDNKDAGAYAVLNGARRVL